MSKNNLIKIKESDKDNNKDKNPIKNKSIYFGNNYIRENNIKYFQTIGNSNNYNIRKEIKIKKPYNLKYNKTNNDYLYNAHKIKQSFIKNNSKEENLRSMSDILNKLIRLKKKINEINIEKRKKEKKIRLFKPIKYFSKSKSESKPNKNKYLLYINDYYKNKLLLQKNKTLTFETLETENNNNINMEENRISLKTNKDVNDSISKLENFNSLDELSLVKSYSNKNKKKIKTKLLSFNGKSKNLSNATTKYNLLDKNSFYFDERKKNIENNNNIMLNHIKYIEKIKESELLGLINRYKHSLNKNKNEEIIHFKSLVFPVPLINYLVTLKKDLTINKYRTEYLNKLDRYNSHKFLRALKFDKTFINNKEKKIGLK